MSIVLDTCALLFWTHEPARLSVPAARALAALGGDARGIVCSASLWEIALKIKAGRLDLGMTADEYLGRVRRLPLEIESVDASLWLESVELPWDHGDPVDRLVVALSRRHGVDVVSSDRAIQAWHDRVTW